MIQSKKFTRAATAETSVTFGSPTFTLRGNIEPFEDLDREPITEIWRIKKPESLSTFRGPRERYVVPKMTGVAYRALLSADESRTD